MKRLLKWAAACPLLVSALPLFVVSWVLFLSWCGGASSSRDPFSLQGNPGEKELRGGANVLRLVVTVPSDCEFRYYGNPEKFEVELRQLQRATFIIQRAPSTVP